MKTKFIVALIFFLLIPTVQATSLGIIKKTTQTEVKPGETTIFKMLFWNTESSMPVQLSLKKAPENWVIIIRPETFTLEKSKPESPPYDTEAEYLNLPIGIVRTTPVRLYVKVPGSEEQGEYDVKIVARGGSLGEGVSVFTERTLKFTVKVTQISLEERILKLGGDAVDKLTGMATAVVEQGNILLIFVSVFAVIGISWIIKRRL
jgi:hypothetical protein